MLQTTLYGGIAKYYDEYGVKTVWHPYEVRFKCPSEHTFDGVIKNVAYPYELEMQILHKSDTSQDKLIVSVMFEAKDDKQSEFLRHLDVRSMHRESVKLVDVDLRTLFDT